MNAQKFLKPNWRCLWSLFGTCPVIVNIAKKSLRSTDAVWQTFNVGPLSMRKHSADNITKASFTSLIYVVVPTSCSIMSKLAPWMSFGNRWGLTIGHEEPTESVLDFKQCFQDWKYLHQCVAVQRKFQVESNVLQYFCNKWFNSAITHWIVRQWICLIPS